MLFPTAADAAALADLQIQSFRQAYKGILPDAYLDGMDAEVIKEEFIQKINDPAKHLIIDRQGGNITGYAYAVAQRMEELPFAGELIELYVHPDFTGKGTGTKLFRDMAIFLSDMDGASFNVWALSANKGACGFYESMGGTKLIEGGIHWPGIDDQTFDAVCYYWT